MFTSKCLHSNRRNRSSQQSKLLPHETEKKEQNKPNVRWKEIKIKVDTKVIKNRKLNYLKKITKVVCYFNLNWEERGRTFKSLKSEKKNIATKPTYTKEIEMNTINNYIAQIQLFVRMTKFLEK